MTDQEKRELDIWIAEHLFGIEVGYDDNGEPYDAKSKFSELIFGWIPRYTTDDRWLGKIKCEIERRGWRWVSAASFDDPPRYAFHVIDGQRQALSLKEAETEELAACLAVKEALGDRT
jgi:hypothetical protein